MLSFGMLGCQNLKSSDLIGTWVVTDESRQRLLPGSQRKGAAKIMLDANGTFVASEVPEDMLYGAPEVADRLFGPSESAERLVTGNGVWKLASREGRQLVELEFRAITVGKRGRLPSGAQFEVSGGLSAVSLYYFQGDPDRGRRVAFERQ